MQLCFTKYIACTVTLLYIFKFILLQNTLSHMLGTKMAVAFANIFLGTVESQFLRRNVLKPLVWKRLFQT